MLQQCFKFTFSDKSIEQGEDTFFFLVVLFGLFYATPYGQTMAEPAVTRSFAVFCLSDMEIWKTCHRTEANAKFTTFPHQ